MPVNTIDDAIANYLPGASPAQKTIIKDTAAAELPEVRQPRLPWLVMNSFNIGEVMTDSAIQESAEAGCAFLLRPQSR
jgi:hypothetical protein